MVAGLMLDGRTILLTGGMGRVGQAIWPAILAEGGRVVVTTRDASKAAAFDAQAPAGARALQLSLDADTDFTAVIGDLAVEGWAIDGLVNNAMGTLRECALDDIRREDWTSPVEVDLHAMLALSQAVVAGSPGSASIVTVSSIYGAMAPDFSIYTDGRTPPSPIYAATKAAQLNLTRYLAVLWAGRGVRVNAVCLGGVVNAQKPEFLAAYGRMVPGGRMIEAREAADAICYLLSEKARAVTGETLFVDAGRHAW
jgi:NAD(P)-dependent dehydrogenase (short-subunit alcohol dehydrogenase family)